MKAMMMATALGSLLALSSQALAQDCVPMSMLSVPSETSFGTLMFEDEFPRRGDFDLNDVVVGYNWSLHLLADGRVSRALLTVLPVASGGSLDTGLAVALPFAPEVVQAGLLQPDGSLAGLSVERSGGQALVRIVDDTKALFGAASGAPVNADPPAVPYGRRGTRALTTERGEVLVVDLRFSSPQPFSAADFDPGDIFIFLTADPSVEVHLARYPGTSRFDASLLGTADDASVAGVRYFVDRSGVPFALALPVFSPFSTEGSRIENLFPRIVEFGASGGTQAADFYWTFNAAPGVAVWHGFSAALPAHHPTARFLSGAIGECPAVFTQCGDGIHVDGKNYQTMPIGGQCWFAESLDRGFQLPSASSVPLVPQVIEKWCTYDQAPNCEQTGGRYTWDEAMAGSTQAGAQGICPAGWRIPTDLDWQAAEISLGMAPADAAGTGWRVVSSSFSADQLNASFGGYLHYLGHTYDVPAQYNNLGLAHFWTSTQGAGATAGVRILGYQSQIMRATDWGKAHGLAVRCVQ